MIASPVKVIMRQADSTAVNNSNVVQSDDTLLLAISGNSSDVLFCECFLIVSGADTAADIKLAWSVPAGVTGYHGPISAGSNIGGWNAVNAATTGAVLSSNLAATYAYGTFAGVSGVHHGALMFVGSTSGTAALQWAQNTATASDLKLLKGSFIRVTKIQ